MRNKLVLFVMMALYASSSNIVSAAIFPTTYTNKSSVLPHALDNLLPNLKNRLMNGVLRQLGGTNFILRGYQLVKQIPSIGKPGWYLIIESDYPKDSGNKEPWLDQYIRVLIDQQGNILDAGDAVALDSFLINIDNDRLASVEIEPNTDKRRQYLGDHVTIMTIDINPLNQNLVNDVSIFESGQQDDGQAILDGAIPRNWYSRIYFKDFDNSGSVQIVIHKFDLSPTQSETWIYCKCDSSGQYRRVDLSDSEIKAFAKECDSDPTLWACEQFPARNSYAELAKFNIKTLGLGPKTR